MSVEDKRKQVIAAARWLSIFSLGNEFDNWPELNHAWHGLKHAIAELDAESGPASGTPPQSVEDVRLETIREVIHHLNDVAGVFSLTSSRNQMYQEAARSIAEKFLP